MRMQAEPPWEGRSQVNQVRGRHNLPVILHIIGDQC